MLGMGLGGNMIINYLESTKTNYRNIVLGMISEIKNELHQFGVSDNAIYLMQAGEKCYNVVVQIVNLYNIEHGQLITGDHDSVRGFYRRHRIKEDTRNKLIVYGNKLHRNFYNHSMTDREAKEMCQYILEVAKRYFKV